MNNDIYGNQVSRTIGSVAIAGIIAAQLLSNNPMEINMKKVVIHERNVYHSPALPSSLIQNNAVKSEDYQGNDQFVMAVSDFYAKLLTSQEPLGVDFEKVLYSNLWELYES